jgi:hypothetical protein
MESGERSSKFWLAEAARAQASAETMKNPLAKRGMERIAASYEAFARRSVTVSLRVVGRSTDRPLSSAVWCAGSVTGKPADIVTIGVLRESACELPSAFDCAESASRLGHFPCPNRSGLMDVTGGHHSLSASQNPDALVREQPTFASARRATSASVGAALPATVRCDTR